LIHNKDQKQEIKGRCDKVGFTLHVYVFFRKEVFLHSEFHKNIEIYTRYRMKAILIVWLHEKHKFTLSFEFAMGPELVTFFLLIYQYVASDGSKDYNFVPLEEIPVISSCPNIILAGTF
ncbi:hypothetical protein ACJX0J_040860, partial [Zea mays]